MELPVEDETPVGASSGIEAPEPGEELKASDEALIFTSSIGECAASMYLSVGQFEVSGRYRICVRPRVNTIWLWHVWSCTSHIKSISC